LKIRTSFNTPSHNYVVIFPIKATFVTTLGILTVIIIVLRCVRVLSVALYVVFSVSMAESGIDLTFDDQTHEGTGNISDTSSSSSVMAHLQSLSASSG